MVENKQPASKWAGLPRNGMEVVNRALTHTRAPKNMLRRKEGLEILQGPLAQAHTRAQSDTRVQTQTHAQDQSGDS